MTLPDWWRFQKKMLQLLPCKKYYGKANAICLQNYHLGMVEISSYPKFGGIRPIGW